MSSNLSPTLYNLDLLLSSCRNTMGIYRKMCLPGLVTIRWTVSQNLAERDFCHQVWPRVTLNFDLLTQIRSLHALEPLSPICTKIGFINFQNIILTSLVTEQMNRRMDGWTNGQTEGQPENIMRPPAMWRADNVQGHQCNCVVRNFVAD